MPSISARRRPWRYRRTRKRVPYWLVASLSFLVSLFISYNAFSFIWRKSSSSLSSSSHRQHDAVQILTTNYGWNQNHPTVGLQFGRSVRQAELWEGIQAHTAYWSEGWQYYLQTTASTTIPNSHRYYVFLDVETCFEAMYPRYVQNIAANSDLRNGRRPLSSSGGLAPKLRALCPVIDYVLQSPLFRRGATSNNTNDAHLVLFDCRPYGPSSCLSRQDNPQLDHRVSLVSLSASSAKKHHQLSGDLDLGLPPPAVTKIQLTPAQEQRIASCRSSDNYDRPYLLTFVGSFRGPVRPKLQDLDNGKDVLILDNLDRLNNSNVVLTRESSSGGGRYQQLLEESQFAAVPRGDNLYSYRFTEVLSAGAIPVILADDWILPFCPELVGDWNELAVLIPEHRVASTVDILREISPQTKCQMRRRAYQFYQTYLSSPEATISGIIECLELKFGKKKD
jgi:hypothetical protein